jgi:hypothetical protein
MGREKVPVERSVDERGEVTERHPSFALIGLSRTQGSQPLFGSPLDVNNGYVTLRISHADRYGHGDGDVRYFPHGEIINIMMSEAQFAQLITCWNSGVGVPCTLNHVQGKTMPGWPDADQVSETDRVREDFNARVAVLKGTVDATVAVMEGILEKKGALTKEEKGRLMEGARALRRFFVDGGPFMTQMFVEAPESTVQKALTEIDAFVARVVQQTGLEALRGQHVLGLRAAQGASVPDAAEREVVGCDECSIFPCAEQACPHIPGAGGVEFEPEEDE